MNKTRNTVVRFKRVLGFGASRSGGWISGDTCHAHTTTATTNTRVCCYTPQLVGCYTCTILYHSQGWAVPHVPRMYHPVLEPGVCCYTPLSRRIVTHVYLAQMSTLPCKHLPHWKLCQSTFCSSAASQWFFMTALLLFETSAWDLSALPFSGVRRLVEQRRNCRLMRIVHRYMHEHHWSYADCACVWFSEASFLSWLLHCAFFAAPEPEEIYGQKRGNHQ